MSIADRILKEYHEAFAVIARQPNAIYLGREEYREAKMLHWGDHIYVIAECKPLPIKDINEATPVKVRESIMGLTLHQAADVNHFAIVYDPQDKPYAMG